MAKRTAKKRKAVRRKRTPNARAKNERAIEAALAGVAHDIRTPLTGILALAELLSSSDLGERERGWASAVKSGAEHLSALTTLIIDAAKAESRGLVLRREAFSPRALAQDVARTLAARCDTKGIASKVSIQGEWPASVAGDGLRLRGALENLADNAVKFTERGSVSFTASAKTGRGKVALTFVMADSGIGLDAAELKRLFKPFAQASEEVSRRYGGSGLGLVFVKRIAKAMGGDLKVVSRKGKGTTFTFTATVERVESTNAPSAGGEFAAPARALTVLCAEDNPYGRVVMNTILTSLGHRADFVETADAAVAAVGRKPYDAVLLDIMLGGTSGIEAAQRIRALPGAQGRTPIIGISGRTETGGEDAARAAGMDFYFTKPVSPGKLAQALASLR